MSSFKILITLTLVIFGLFFFTASAFAATYYVSTSGDDANSGTSGAPFKTVQKCINEHSAGDTCKIGAGTFYEKLSISSGGSVGLDFVLEGTYSGGVWSTIIDGSTAFAGSSWTEDVSIGAGVYKAEPPTKPYFIGEVIDGVLRTCYRASVAYSLTHYAENDLWYGGLTQAAVKYWDGFDVLWFGTGTAANKFEDNAGTAVWMKYANGADPDTKILRYSGNGACIDAGGADYLTIKNLKLQGCRYGIEIDGDNVTIDTNEITNGQRGRIYMSGASSNLRITGNKIHDNGHSTVFTPGPWSNWYSGYSAESPYKPAYGTAAYAATVNQKYYGLYKGLALDTPGYEHDFGIYMVAPSAGSSNVEIDNNEIYNTLATMIGFRDVAGLEIHNNYIHNGSAEGVFPYLNHQNVEIHGNRFANINISMRYQGMTDGDAPKQSYFYNNTMYNANGNGILFYWHANDINAQLPPAQHEQYIYHNSIVGGYNVFAISNYITGGVPHAYLVDNLISKASGDIWHWVDDSVGAFDYNFLYPTQYKTGWNGTYNVYGPTAYWSEASEPDFSLPTGSPAIQAGIDVSKTFTINGFTHSGALPGFSPGYFSGSAPDMGAKQSGIVSSDTTPPSAPVNVRMQ